MRMVALVTTEDGREKVDISGLPSFSAPFLLGIGTPARDRRENVYRRRRRWRPRPPHVEPISPCSACGGGGGGGGSHADAAGGGRRRRRTMEGGGGGEERGHLPKNRFSLLLLLSFPLSHPSGRHNNRSRRAADPCQPPLLRSKEGKRGQGSIAVADAMGSGRHPMCDVPTDDGGVRNKMRN